MVLASRLSTRVAGLAVADAERVMALVARANLPVEPPRLPLARWLELMSHDKKVQSGVIRFVLLDALGHAIVKRGVEEAALASVVG